ncbi:MAG: 4Fe-4S binding protein [Lentimicrobiaceae bacterium]|nr:4Fe-4S binding protein [Lentimicrobiaceae bacterium]
MARVVKKNYYRLVLQWLVVLMLAYLVIRPYFDKTYTSDFEAYCPFGGLQAFSSFLANSSLACSMTTTQISMGLALMLGIFIFSKLFCSYICPIGTFTEWLSRLGRKMKLNITISGMADRLLRVVKYAILFITFYYSVSSSELFCKTFDPYYAVFSGFSSDVVLSYAIMALFLAIPGSFFVRQLWCKYFCPLSAASNIFTYGYFFLGITGVYMLLTLVAGISISWIWLLAALCLTGMILETTRLKFLGMPFFKITRNADTCTSCRICDKVCPMAIKISDKPSVEHIDCHLCGDCITQCPEKDTLMINRKKLNWLPAAAVVVLVVSGLVFASFTDIPTINIRWGTSEQISKAGIYRQAGLTSIKCYGSSMSFANHMKELKGVLGVETFVSDHSIKVFYDKSVLTDEEIKKAIFTPVSSIVAPPAQGLSSVAVAEAAIDQFFDPNDAMLLEIRFKQVKGILAFETVFGEPVHALIYFDSRLLNTDKIKQLIEEEKLKWAFEGETYEAETDFKVASIRLKEEAISLSAYLSLKYEPVVLDFNDFESYQPSQLDSLDVPFIDGADPELTDMPWYLLSHLSNEKGVVRFATLFTDNGMVLRLTYSPALTGKEQIMNLLNQPDLHVHMSDGTEKSMPNPYRF